MRREEINGYTHRTPSRRKVVVGLLVAWLTSTAVAAVGISRVIDEPLPTAHAAAIAIAEGERARLEALPFDALEVSERYRSATWVRARGLAPGQIALRVHSESEQGHVRVPYQIEWRAEAQGGDPHLRRISVRVSWAEPGRMLAQVERTSLRAGAEKPGDETVPDVTAR